MFSCFDILLLLLFVVVVVFFFLTCTLILVSSLAGNFTYRLSLSDVKVFVGGHVCDVKRPDSNMLYILI